VCIIYDLNRSFVKTRVNDLNYVRVAGQRRFDKSTTLRSRPKGSPHAPDLLANGLDHDFPLSGPIIKINQNNLLPGAKPEISVHERDAQ